MMGNRLHMELNINEGNRMSKKCSIIIPTYNRPNYLKRILSYYHKYGRNFEIIVADSSSNENKKLNKKSVLIFSNLDIQYIDKYPSKIGLSHKINDALNYITTKYSVLCADDDFIIPKGINRAVNFLENNEDFSVAQGHYIFFYLKNEDKRERKFCWNSSAYLDKSITFPEAESRLAFHLSNYQLTTLYAVHRTDLLKVIFKDTVKFTDDDRFGEFLPSMLTLIYGKMKHMDLLYAAREIIIDCAGRKGKNLNDFMKNGTYEKKYTKFRECLVIHLTNNSQLSIEESEKMIDEAISAYLKKYYSKSFKRILIGKMSNLLNALDLPESLDKNIRTLYRKMFTPIYNLNKSKEIYDFRKKVESPNSKYFDDFERIRSHVLLYAENDN